VAGCCEHGNEPSCSGKGSEFLDYLGDYQLLKKDSAPCSQLVSYLVSKVATMNLISMTRKGLICNTLRLLTMSVFVGSVMAPHAASLR
jgi:hypothetical protein